LKIFDNGGFQRRWIILNHCESKYLDTRVFELFPNSYVFAISSPVKSAR